MNKIEEQMEAATHRRVTIHEVVDSGSAFGITEDGDMVFINQRIVSALDVKAGDVWDAYLLLNYPDKREMIPWRALRLSTEGMEPMAKVKKEVDEQLLHAIVRLLTNEDYLTATEISETLNVPLVDVYRTLKNQPGMIMSVPAYFVP
jgi:hypothetical protein